MNVLGDHPSSGVLLHVSSLPGGLGIGDLGAPARKWLDWLAEAGQQYWQVLPCSPTGYRDSPYQSISGFAGNPLFVSIDTLIEWGLLDSAPPLPRDDQVNYHMVGWLKGRLLTKACRAFDHRASRQMKREFDDFVAENDATWLDDHALYTSLKFTHYGAPWYAWDACQAHRQQDNLRLLRVRQAERIRESKLIQYFFFKQWSALRSYAAARGISIIGDCPIYVAHDSCEVWQDTSPFDMTDEDRLRVVAGVPPDYFSATGQRWGNPLYRWDKMREDGFAWWQRRLQRCMHLFDITRIDHFRAFDSYWEIPASEPTALNGVWRQGPGEEFFDRMIEVCGELPVIAEDLGMLVPSVHALRDHYGFPGMRVLQFGFDGEADNLHHPDHVPENTVCYTATHDNDTTVGWYDAAPDDIRQRFDDMGAHPMGVHWAMIRMAMATPARLVIVPMQDVLGLGNGARLNTPGTESGNWTWRLTPEQLTGQAACALRAACREYGRLPAILA